MKRPLIDQHVHTNASPDANRDATMTAYIEKAKKMGLPGVIFTDHVDMDTPVELFKTFPDYQTYSKNIKPLNTPDFFVRMGVEIGYQPHIQEKIETFIQSHPFDFVICSIHLGDKLDFYNGDFFIGKTQQEAYQRYFELVLESVENFQDYEVFGHLDYIIRYGDFEDKAFDIDDYQPLIDTILSTIIKNGKGIEVNTSGIRYNLGVMHPNLAILKRYKALGGKIITLGSDAHKVDDFYSDFEHAIALILKAGFRYITEFKARQPYFIEL